MWQDLGLDKSQDCCCQVQWKHSRHPIVRDSVLMYVDKQAEGCGEAVCKAHECVVALRAEVVVIV